MQLEPVVATSPLDRFVARIPQPWRVPLCQLALVWLALILWAASDWADMADQWWNSSTYNHILLVPAIVVWLVWARMKELVRLTPTAWWPGLLLLAGALFLWLLGALSGLNLARQLAAVLT
ncbi:MAG: exosortase A, partial [Proteobacteria bacterium]